MSKPAPLPSYEDLHKCFSYEPETGLLTCKEAHPEVFPTETSRNHWNGRRKGKVCTSLDGTKKYYILKWKRKTLKVHRVIWKMMYNEDPYIVDHINGVETDNRLANLRNTDEGVNSRNIYMKEQNTSGVSGVSLFSRYGTEYWQAGISLQGKKTCLYQGKDFFEAVCRRKGAEVKIGTDNYNHNHFKRL